MSATADKAPATILVVDDNLQNREVAEGHLVGSGYTVIQAEGGEQALALLSASSEDRPRRAELIAGGSEPSQGSETKMRRPDLVLLDVLMPGMDGFETCRRIRLLPQVGDTPVLFLTALGDLATHKAALDSGADDFLTKPLNRTELLIRVRSLLRIKQLGDELKGNYDVIRQQRDALLAANRAKEELTALIVHDLKNPLSSILSNAQFVLASNPANTDERSAMADIVRASQSMVRMVMNLLDVSRSEDGALVPRVTDFHLPTLLAEVCSEMGRRVEDKDQRLALSVAPDVGTLRGDRDFIRRIAENLIDNAYKYGPRHASISIDVRVATMDDGVEPAIEIRVRDEGEGIPAAYRQLIFEKYARVDGRPANEARNSYGLGLVFCRRAVAVHGGAIWVEESGRGGCFCVRLPASRLPLTTTATPMITPAKGSVAFG